MGAVPRFQSILFERSDRAADVDGLREPDFFDDLNLGRVVAAVLSGREEYDLAPFFYAPLHDVAAVRYRHDVLRDLEREAVREPVEEFGHQLRRMRAHLAQAGKRYYGRQKQRWLLDAARVYCDAVVGLSDQLSRVDVASRGMRGLRDYLAGYLGSGGYRSLAADARAVQAGLAKVKYCVHVRGGRVTVTRYDGEDDYSTDVEKTFARFKHGAVKDYRVTYRDTAEMNHVEAQILDRVARLYPDTFRALDEFCTRHADFVDPTIAAFDREVQFYLGYLSFAHRLGREGLQFCYPEVSEGSQDIEADDAFDLALAAKLVPERVPVVCNGLRLAGGERIAVVTGPNQGGKTTFARMFGQLPYLASLGLPVPASRARLFLPDRVFSHFEREENLATLRGKLDDELVRIRDILGLATDRSILVMNESFTSTTLNDARFIGTRMLERVIDVGARAVYVTFVDELASLDDSIVSMVAGIVADNPAERTFQVVRRAADGLAYAGAIAAKYGLTGDSLRRRIIR